MPRRHDDEYDDRDDRRPAKRRPTDEPTESGPWMAIGVTLGCVAVAFAGIMGFLLATAPKGEPPLAAAPVEPPTPPPVVPKMKGDGPSVPSPDPFPPVPKPPEPRPFVPSNTLQPDDWTPPPWRRPNVDVSAGRTLTATPTAGVKSIPRLSVSGISYLEGPRLLLVKTGNVLKFFDATTGRELPLPDMVQSRGQLLTKAGSPDQTVLFLKDANSLHRFDVATRRWESAPMLQTAGGVTVVAADRVLALVPDGNGPPRLRLFRWSGNGQAPVPTAEAAVSGYSHANYLTYDPATATAYLISTSPAVSSARVVLSAYRVSGRALTRTRHEELESSRAPPVVSWDGSKLFVDKHVLDLTDGQFTKGKFQQLVRAVVPTAVVTTRSLLDPETGGGVKSPWLATDELHVSDGGTAIWVNEGRYPSQALNCYTIGTAPGTGGPTVPPVGPVIAPPRGNPFGQIEPKLLASLPLADKFTSLRFSDKHDLLSFATSAGVTILDTKTGSPLPLPPVTLPRRVRVAEFSPDQSVVFAGDGQSLHRMDLTTRKWESRPFVGTRITPVDASTLLVQTTAARSTSLALVRWEADAAKELSRLDLSTLHTMGYDPTAKALFVLHGAPTQDAVLERYTLDGTAFRSDGKKPFAATQPPQRTVSPLTADGKYFFHSLLAAPTDLTFPASTQYPETLVGSVGDRFVGTSGKLYAAGNVPATVGQFPHPVTSAAAAPDGKTLWVYDGTGKKLHHYQLRPSSKKGLK